jgi:hypothetical protein
MHMLICLLYIQNALKNNEVIYLNFFSRSKESDFQMHLQLVQLLLCVEYFSN